MFHKHEKFIKRTPISLISDSLSNATRIPVLITSIVKQPVESHPPATKYLNDDDVFYDASDHISDGEIDDDEFDDDQAPEDDISDMVIKFHPLSVWNNSEDNTVDYELPPGFGEIKKCFSCFY